MSVSKRSQMTPNPVHDEPDRAMQLQQRLRNPHHGLKEKLRALMLLHEQQKQASHAHKNPPLRQEQEQRKQETLIMRENKIPNFPNSTATRTFVLPQPPPLQPSIDDIDDAKENLLIGAHRIIGFSSPRRASSIAAATTTATVSSSDSGSNNVARKLSMGVVEGGLKKQGSVGSRIMVFVRLKPMNKEKEAGSWCCVRIVDHHDVYLTKFVNKNIT